MNTRTNKKEGLCPSFLLVRIVDSKRAAERKRSKKVSGGHFLARGRVHGWVAAGGTPVDSHPY